MLNSSRWAHLQDKKKETDAMFKEHMFYKQLLKEAKFRLKTSKVDHDTLVTKTQEEKLGFESLQRGLSTLDDQFKRYHHQNEQLRAMQELLDPAIDADEMEETEEF
ncbi:unnamed protein product [Oikopleura dioica]|uniref:Uncharacterized protein n=1 Tax=Oikopleura dioica TaxID=34765 RepID=E4X6N8_OIKDI|nr:unnamed protein product [Oikopleura dioica]